MVHPYSPIIHDKTPLITPFLLPLFKAHKSKNPALPFFLGVSGIQGSGKTSLCVHLSKTLPTLAPFDLPSDRPLKILTFSIDDLYLPHETLTALHEKSPDNPFLYSRGNPGTHDVELGIKFFEQLDSASSRAASGGGGEDVTVKLPSYDKSKNQGKGDRVDPALWKSETPPWDMVIFEGWCVGFTDLPDEEVERRWKNSRESGVGRLGKAELKDVLWVNNNLKRYKALWDRFDAFLHIDGEDISYVYEWRIQQEHSLITERGMGMTDDEVVQFVDRYMPAYELYLEGLRSGLFKKIDNKADEGRNRKQLRIVIGQDRNAVRNMTL